MFYFEKKVLDNGLRVIVAPMENTEAVTLLAKKSQRPASLSETDSMALVGILSTQLVHQQFVASYRPPTVVGEKDDVKTVIRTPVSGEKGADSCRRVRAQCHHASLNER